MRSIILLLLLLCSNTHASIFGKDDRIDTKDASPLLQELGRSVPALIQKNKIKALPNGKFQLEGSKLRKMGFCSNETFSEESQIANCSASYIGENRILTAAHCLDDDQFKCESYDVVFDYQKHENPTKDSHILDKGQIYSCKRVIYHKFDKTKPAEDLAIIELDRNVEGRTPIKLNLENNLKVNDPLWMIGYPLGISQKVVDDGFVSSIDRNNVSFKHNLDSFSVNSGGPVFTTDGSQVGVLVRGTGVNYTRSLGEKCYRWHVELQDGFSESNDLTPLGGLTFIPK